MISAEYEAEIVRWIERGRPIPIAKRNRLDVYGDGPFARTSVGRRGTDMPYELYRLAFAIRMPGADSVTVSEYLPGQGVAWHIDRAEAGPAIRTLSLLSDAVLRFARGISDELVEVALPRRSLLTLSGPARHAPWQHELAAVAERRISIAFRRSATSASPTSPAA